MDFGDKRLGILLLLVKLDVLGVRKVTYSIASTMLGASAPKPPPCSIQLAIVSLALEYLQFVVKKNHPGEEWFPV